MVQRTMKCAMYNNGKQPLQITKVRIPEPKKGEIRVKVVACSVCHSDITIGEGNLPFVKYPMIPGHEIVGFIDKMGENMEAEFLDKFKIGDRVGVGFFGHRCGYCKDCMEDSWTTCPNVETCGGTMNGGYAEYMVCKQDSLVHIPTGLKFIETAPLMCAGVTVYSTMRKLNIKSGELVAIHGIGGLGHLAIQFARKMGYEVAAVGLDKSIEKMCLELGAHHFMTNQDCVERLNELGGAKMIVCCVPDAPSIENVFKGLGSGGKLLVLALVEELKFNVVGMIRKNQSVCGMIAGDSRDMYDTLKFASNQGVRPMINGVYPLEKVQQCLDNIADAKFRNVIVLDNEYIDQ